MPSREFEITVRPDGSVELHVRGYKGKKCLEAVQLFKEIVGEMESLQHTREFYEPDETVVYRVDCNHK